MRAQQAVAQAVKRADPHAARADRQHRRDPREHLAGRLVGESNGENAVTFTNRSEEHTSELQSLTNLVCRLLLEKKNSRPDAAAPARLLELSESESAVWP